jgi:hypothetical protein
LSPGTKIFSIFLLLALLFGAFFFGAFRGGFFFGSGCLTVCTASPAKRLLRLAGAVALAALGLALGFALGLALVAVLFFLPQRHCAKAFPAADVCFFANALPALEQCALFISL